MFDQIQHHTENRSIFTAPVDGARFSLLGREA
jgi:hypothetical protein